jgi:hypothetical protein
MHCLAAHPRSRSLEPNPLHFVVCKRLTYTTRHGGRRAHHAAYPQGREEDRQINKRKAERPAAAVLRILEEKAYSPKHVRVKHCDSGARAEDTK